MVRSISNEKLKALKMFLNYKVSLKTPYALKLYPVAFKKTSSLFFSTKSEKELKFVNLLSSIKKSRLFQISFSIFKFYFVFNVRVASFVNNNFFCVFWSFMIYLALSCVHPLFTVVILVISMEVFTFTLYYWLLCKN